MEKSSEVITDNHVGLMSWNS